MDSKDDVGRKVGSQRDPFMVVCMLVLIYIHLSGKVITSSHTVPGGGLTGRPLEAPSANKRECILLLTTMKLKPGLKLKAAKQF